MKRLFFPLLALVLAACASPTPSASVVGTAMAQTQVAQPTATIVPTSTPEPTATLVPLADIDLTPLLVQAGDLPAGVSTGQLFHELGDRFSQVPLGAQVIYQEFSKEGKEGGYVVVWLYETAQEVDKAYTAASRRISESDSKQDVVGVGDAAIGTPPPVAAAAILSASGLGGNSAPLAGNLVFKHCHAVVAIRVAYDVEDMLPIATYAKNLDKRLAPLVCR